jgi:hypothetical protein
VGRFVNGFSTGLSYKPRSIRRSPARERHTLKRLVNRVAIAKLRKIGRNPDAAGFPRLDQRGNAGLDIRHESSLSDISRHAGLTSAEQSDPSNRPSAVLSATSGHRGPLFERTFNEAYVISPGSLDVEWSRPRDGCISAATVSDRPNSAVQSCFRPTSAYWVLRTLRLRMETPRLLSSSRNTKDVLVIADRHIAAIERHCAITKTPLTQSSTSIVKHITDHTNYQ